MKTKEKNNLKRASRRIDYKKGEYLVDIEALLKSLKIEKDFYESIFMELTKYDHTKMVLEACFTENNFKKMKDIMHVFYFFGFSFVQISRLFGNRVSSKSISGWVHAVVFEKKANHEKANHEKANDEKAKKKKENYDLYRKPIKIDFEKIINDKEVSFTQILKLKIKIFNSQTGQCIYSLEPSAETKDLRKKKQVVKSTHIKAYKKLMNSK